MTQDSLNNMQSQETQNKQTASWNSKYFLSIGALAVIWGVVYAYVLPFANFITFDVIGFGAESFWGASIEFFIYDTIKILMLLVMLIYVLAWLRATLNTERVRDYLAGKKRAVGYALGSMFGAVTPFCSCSSIPLFLGFTTARIPVGITMSFLITSPLINEVAVILLWGLLGWKFTLIYVGVGLLAGIVGGFLMDSLKAERWLQPFILETIKQMPQGQTPMTASMETPKLSVKDRHDFAYSEMVTIFKRVWKWVFIGVGIGAGLHGFVPESWFEQNLGAGQWWSVPSAVLVGIPLYSNVTGIIPVMESLLIKGLPIGTTLAFCMSSVAASIPEFMLLRQVMTFKLQATFIAYLWIMFTIVGWLFNYLGPYLV